MPRRFDEGHPACRLGLVECGGAKPRCSACTMSNRHCVPLTATTRVLPVPSNKPTERPSWHLTPLAPFSSAPSAFDVEEVNYSSPRRRLVSYVAGDSGVQDAPMVPESSPESPHEVSFRQLRNRKVPVMSALGNYAQVLTESLDQLTRPPPPSSSISSHDELANYRNCQLSQGQKVRVARILEKKRLDPNAAWENKESFGLPVSDPEEDSAAITASSSLERPARPKRPKHPKPPKRPRRSARLSKADVQASGPPTTPTPVAQSVVDSGEHGWAGIESVESTSPHRARRVRKSTLPSQLTSSPTAHSPTIPTPMPFIPHVVDGQEEAEDDTAAMEAVELSLERARPSPSLSDAGPSRARNTPLQTLRIPRTVERRSTANASTSTGRRSDGSILSSLSGVNYPPAHFYSPASPTTLVPLPFARPAMDVLRPPPEVRAQSIPAFRHAATPLSDVDTGPHAVESDSRERDTRRWREGEECPQVPRTRPRKGEVTVGRIWAVSELPMAEHLFCLPGRP